MEPNRQLLTRVKEIFTEVRDVPAGKERDQLVAQACGNDAELRREVESMLEVYGMASDFLSRDASGATLAESTDLRGTVIGGYHLVELIGEGGFGEVYRAKQSRPLQREVALKIIKLGMDSRNVIARFEAEQQALARMSHPGIAQVFDAGITESGRPYFVMELVQGVPFLEYCNQHRLPLTERLNLFREVCEAVQHAHQKDILHRDLKPSNILVAEENGQPRPKIIDFGVAKSLEGRLTEQTLATLQEMLIGTPLYMSPEQLDSAVGDIDTRSDIYSLGIILYELVAGSTPLEGELPSPLTIAEMRKALIEKDAPRPSRRLHSKCPKTTTIAAERQIKPPTLERLLRGDLDWVVMKAIEKDRDRRYDDIGDLATDLARYLNHEPVSAGPPSMRRKAQGFYRRHRLASVVILSIGATLLLGIGIVAIGYFKMTRPLPDVLIPGWKLEPYCSLGKLGANSFAIRPDGSVLAVGEWGKMPKGLYWLRKGETCVKTNAFSLGPAYVDPEDAIELPEGIYVSVHNAPGKVLFVPSTGGEPRVVCDDPRITNPYVLRAVPENYNGSNVGPGDLLLFDNAYGNIWKSSVWVVNKSSGKVCPLLAGNTLHESYANGSFSSDGMLYAGLNDNKADGVGILQISPEGESRVVLRDFYLSPVKADLHRTIISVHPVTGEIFFCARENTFAFSPGETSPRRVLTVGGDMLRWAPDGSALYLLVDKTIYTLSGPGIESRPVSRKRNRKNGSAAPNPAGPWTKTYVFQQGLNGYDGTVDTHLREVRPDDTSGDDLLVYTDNRPTPNPQHDHDYADHGLLRFDVFGIGAQRIPPGSRIISATLTLTTGKGGGGDGGKFHRMLMPWDESATWNSFGGGIQADGQEAAENASAVAGNYYPYIFVGHGEVLNFNITSDVAAWSAGQPNHGWVILPWGEKRANGWGFVSSEHPNIDQRPRLRVVTLPPPNRKQDN